MKTKAIFLVAVTLFCVSAFGFVQNCVSATNQNNSSKPAANKVAQNVNRPNYKPRDGYVPDEQTAIAIAVAVWTPIYGKEKIENEKPYKARLKNEVWTVTGSLPPNTDGGVAEIEIAKDDGRILRVIHGK